MNTNIYILKLECNKFYVGKTDNLEKRSLEHYNGTASTYTKKYKPLSIEKIIPNASPFDEDKYTIEYMGKYGIDNVRGGIYVTEALDSLQRYTIKKSIWGANDCCTKCGRKGHFVNFCKETTDVNGENILPLIKSIPISIKTCFQCGQTGHYSNECHKIKAFNKKIEAFACQYCDKEFETQKGATFHENVHCKSKIEAFACQYCDKEFETQKGATYHENFYCKSKKYY